MGSFSWYKKASHLVTSVKAGSRKTNSMGIIRLRPVKSSVSQVPPPPQNQYSVDWVEPNPRDLDHVKKAKDSFSASKQWQVARIKNTKRSSATKAKLRSVFVRIRQFLRRIFGRRRRPVSDSIVFQSFRKSWKQWDMALLVAVFGNVSKVHIHGSKDQRTLTTRLSMAPKLRNLQKIDDGKGLTALESKPKANSSVIKIRDAQAPLYVSIRIENLYPFPIKSEFIVEPIYPFTKETVFDANVNNPNLLLYALALEYVNPIVGLMILFATLCVSFALKVQEKTEFIPRPFVCGNRKFPTLTPVRSEIITKTTMETLSKDPDWRFQQSSTPMSPGCSADVFSPDSGAMEEIHTSSTLSPDRGPRETTSLEQITEPEKIPQYKDANLSDLDFSFTGKNIDFTSCGIQTQKLIRDEAFSISSALLQSRYAFEFLKGILEDPIFSNDLNIDDVVVTHAKMDWSQAKSQINSDDEDWVQIDTEVEDSNFDWYENLIFEEENIGIEESKHKEEVTTTEELSSLEFVDWVSERFPKLLKQAPVPLPTIEEEGSPSRYINVHFNNNYDVMNLSFQQDEVIYRQILSFDKDTPPAEFNLHSYDKSKTPQRSILKHSATTHDFSTGNDSETAIANTENFIPSFTCDFNSLRNILQNVAKQDIRAVVKCFGNAFEGLISTANYSRISFLRLALDAQKHFSEIYHVTLGIANEFEVVMHSNDSSIIRFNNIMSTITDCRDRLLVVRQKSEHVKECIPSILTSFILQRREILSKRKTLLPIYYKFMNECSKKYHIKPESFHKISGKKSFDEGCKFLVGVSISNLEESLYNDVAQLETAGVLIEYMSNSLEERLLEFGEAIHIGH